MFLHSLYLMKFKKGEFSKKAKIEVWKHQEKDNNFPGEMFLKWKNKREKSIQS